MTDSLTNTMYVAQTHYACQERNWRYARYARASRDLQYAHAACIIILTYNNMKYVLYMLGITMKIKQFNIGNNSPRFFFF